MRKHNHKRNNSQKQQFVNQSVLQKLLEMQNKTCHVQINNHLPAENTTVLVQCEWDTHSAAHSVSSTELSCLLAICLLESWRCEDLTGLQQNLKLT